jgi:hypothetical protein
LAGFPKIHARTGDADTPRNFGNRQAGLDASVAEIAGEAWLTRQFELLFLFVVVTARTTSARN